MVASREKKGLATLGEVVAAKRGAVPAAVRETFSSAMTRLALEKGVSHYDIAKICKTTRRTVIAWSQGSAVPTRGEFGRMCVALPQLRHFPPDFALERDVEKSADEDLPETVGLMVWADGGEATPVVPATFGENLRRVRRAEDLIPSQVAEIVGYGVTGQDVEAWEANRSEPSLPQAVKLLERLPRLVEGPPPPSVVETWKKISEGGGEDDDLPERGSAERTAQVRAIARKFLEEAPTPEARQRRLEALREELPRAQRRALGIRGEMPALRPSPKGELRLPKCPRCQAEVSDLREHRVVCPNRSEKSWETAGWRTCERSRHPHHWNVKTKAIGSIPNPPADMVLLSMHCEAHRPAKVRSWELDMGAPGSVQPPPMLSGMVSRSPVPSEDEAVRKAVSEEAKGSASPVLAPPTAPDSVASSDGLELAARCLVLADMLWPAEAHHLVIWFAAGVWNVTVENTKDQGRAVRSGGTAVDKREAVHALADALRAETKERARAAEDMARLLED